MTSVHIVMGRTGEYGDANEWLVRAWGEKADADALAARLNSWCEEHKFAQSTPKLEAWDGAERPTEDPKFSCQYTGTSYSVTEVPFGPVSAT